ncbi:hypothetical protein ASPZODRAFT_158678 [Penicilliopsis zonata CBS 506.65]|uniref:BTB domain-containing protein n=1 Tax=Penicilliopsis zonata CBS 506.65 TaxID=1073090 RepID=A0A1L9SKW0_9EURO|nr:hypothetical protein ASPZODRAFT_158678 [Penicilliopsis zonata CBS 506.65]OJJ47790.1 hypothetical protein ASPZODRAFT_158678 [Penicilliopsis zonata CBS 506.65]
MEEATHIIDPEGEVIIILRSAAAPFAPWDEEIDEWPADEQTADEPAVAEQPEEANTDENPIEDCDEEGEASKKGFRSESHIESGCYRIQVSAKHLMLPSPIFKRILTGPWKESHLLTEKGSVEIHATGWDLEAFLILMNILHCQTQNLPQEISLDLLAKVAVLTDYYGCHAVIRFLAKRWILMLNASFPQEYSRDSMLWMWVSWAMRLDSQFKQSTLLAITQSDRIIRSLGLPIPVKVIDAINSRREARIASILFSLEDLRHDFLQGHRGCSFECSSIMLGALTKHMHSNALLSPEPVAPFSGWRFGVNEDDSSFS